MDNFKLIYDVKINNVKQKKKNNNKIIEIG